MYYFTSNEWAYKRSLFYMSFVIKNDEVWKKCKQIWGLIWNKVGIKFHSLPIHDKKYIKTKIKEYGRVIKTKFLGNDVPKENKHYTCIACVTIDSVTRMAKKNYSQVYLEECNYKINKMSTFINTELESDSDSDTDDELKSDSDNYDVNYNYNIFIFDFRNSFFIIVIFFIVVIFL